MLKSGGGENLWFSPPPLCTLVYLQHPPPNPKSGPPFPPLQQQRRSNRTGSKHPQPQILSIMPFKHPFLHKQRMRMMMSIQRQQLSPIPKQFNIEIFPPVIFVALPLSLSVYFFSFKNVTSPFPKNLLLKVKYIIIYNADTQKGEL